MVAEVQSNVSAWEVYDKGTAWHRDERAIVKVTHSQVNLNRAALGLIGKPRRVAFYVDRKRKRVGVGEAPKGTTFYMLSPYVTGSASVNIPVALQRLLRPWTFTEPAVEDGILVLDYADVPARRSAVIDVG